MLSRILNNIGFYYKNYHSKQTQKHFTKQINPSNQIKWNQLISLCSISNQKLINAILKNNQSYLTNQLVKKSDNSLLQIEQSDFPYALIVLAINSSNISNEKLFIRKFMEAFLTKSLIKLKDTSKKQLNGQPLFKSDIPIICQNKDVILKNLIKVFSQSYRQKLFTEKGQVSSKNMIVQFLVENKHEINSYQCLKQAIDCLDCLADKSFTESLKFSSLLAFFLTKIKKIFENDSQYTKNLSLGYNEKNISIYSYLNILNKNKKIKIIDRSLIKYFIDIICSQEFIDQKRSNPNSFKILIFYGRCLQSYSQFYNQITKTYPLVQKYKKRVYSYLRQPNLSIDEETFKQLYLESNLYTILQIKYHEKFIQLKSKIVNNYLIIVEKPQIPKLDQVQILMLGSIWPKLKEVDPEKNRIYPIVKRFYPNIVEGLNTKIKVKQRNKEDQLYQTKFTHNQFMHRTCQALQLLKIAYRKQVKIQDLQRNVDILLEGQYQNIVIQCDGDYHIDYTTLNLTIKTGQRNMQLLILGYKLITLNIYEFNINRDTGSILNILKQKLQIIKNQNAVYVS